MNGGGCEWLDWTIAFYYSQSIHLFYFRFLSIFTNKNTVCLLSNPFSINVWHFAFGLNNCVDLTAPHSFTVSACQICSNLIWILSINAHPPKKFGSTKYTVKRERQHRWHFFYVGSVSVVVVFVVFLFVNFWPTFQCLLVLMKHFFTF